jgi:hypothetical protein
MRLTSTPSPLASPLYTTLPHAPHSTWWVRVFFLLKLSLFVFHHIVTLTPSPPSSPHFITVNKQQLLRPHKVLSWIEEGTFDTHTTTGTIIKKDNPLSWWIQHVPVFNGTNHVTTFLFIPLFYLLFSVGYSNLLGYLSLNRGPCTNFRDTKCLSSNKHTE